MDGSSIALNALDWFANSDFPTCLSQTNRQRHSDQTARMLEPVLQGSLYELHGEGLMPHWQLQANHAPNDPLLFLLRQQAALPGHVDHVGHVDVHCFAVEQRRQDFLHKNGRRRRTLMSSQLGNLQGDTQIVNQPNYCIKIQPRDQVPSLMQDWWGVQSPPVCSDHPPKGWAPAPLAWCWWLSGWPVTLSAAWCQAGPFRAFPEVQRGPDASSEPSTWKRRGKIQKISLKKNRFKQIDVANWLWKILEIDHASRSL